MRCSGTLTTWPHSTKTETSTEVTFVIDLKGGLVRGDLGQYSISSKTGGKIQFERVNGDITTVGQVDRYSGRATMTMPLPGNTSATEPTDHWELSCKPAKPLF